ncbi:MAG TPA: DUF6600 domain-containing protein [Polyangiaceae bacterium]|nr:DUF6600 domain-containing protein [Polyangiaceae bacterium]
MISWMFNWSPRLLAAVLALATGLQAPAALAQAREPNTWTDAPADAPAPEPSPAPESGEFQDTDPRAISDFEPVLDPHGQWVNDPTYGTVWVPNRQVVGADFAPYVTSGRWSMTANGDWIWVSDYPFGWVVFHYGRWVWIANTGWAWIPGRKYSHAWVVWRVPQDDYAYVGWAPAPPSYVWVNGAAVSVWFGVHTPYVFCPSYYVFDPYMHHHIVRDHRHVHYIAGHTHRYVPGGRTWGPPPARARIPARALPAQRVSANPRALAASRRETARRVLPAAAPASRSLQSASVARQGRLVPSRTISSAPGPRPLSPSASRPAPISSGPRTLSDSRPVMRSPAPASLTPSASRPVMQTERAASMQRPVPAPSARPVPMRSYTPSAMRSAPARSYSPPSRSAPVRTYAPSAPTRTYAPPAMRAAPARSFSPSSMRAAPARSYAPSMRSAPARSVAPRASSGPRRR